MSPKLPRISGEKLIRALCRNGYTITRQKGSHVILRNLEGVIVTVPRHDQLKLGTLRNILRTTEISVVELIEML